MLSNGLSLVRSCFPSSGWLHDAAAITSVLPLPCRRSLLEFIRFWNWWWRDLKWNYIFPYIVQKEFNLFPYKHHRSYRRLSAQRRHTTIRIAFLFHLSFAHLFRFWNRKLDNVWEAKKNGTPFQHSAFGCILLPRTYYNVMLLCSYIKKRSKGRIR